VLSNKLRFTIIIFLVIIGTSYSKTQVDTIPFQFRHISIKNGLSQGMINWITQDKYGFMWFATKDGLNRYDGYEFKIYRHDPADSNSVGNSFITVIKEDRSGRLWIGTSTGLDIFEREKETFTHFPCSESPEIIPYPSKVDAIRGSGIADIEEDSFGNIWIATNQGLSKISLPQGQKINPAKLNITCVIATNDWVRAHVDKEGRIWGFIRSKFPFTINSRNNSLTLDTLKLDRPDILFYNTRPFTRTDLIMVEDPRSRKLYGIHNFGIIRIDQKSKQTRTITEFIDLDMQMIPSMVTIDGKGILWLPAQGGFLRFDPASGRLMLLTSEDPEQKKILTDVKCCYRDRDGLIWLGTAGYGIMTYDPRIERFHNQPGKSVRWMRPGTDNNIILNESNFVSVYDPRKNRYITQYTDKKVSEITGFRGSLNGTDAIIHDSKGSFWLARGGIVKFDPILKQIRRYIPTDENGKELIPDLQCFPLFLDRDTLWFGAQNALRWFDINTHKFGLYKYPIPSVDNPYTFLQTIYRDPNGIFWLGTVRGLLRLDPINMNWKHYKNNPKDSNTLGVDLVFSVLPDPNEPERYLWIGTNGGGLNRFEKLTGKIKRFTKKDGLPNDVVYGIVNDDDGKLWMSTNNGISRFNPKTEMFRNFSYVDGLQNDEFNRNAYGRLKDGTIFFGGVSGFNVFNPHDMKEDFSPVKVLITDIYLMNKSIKFWTEGAPLKRPSYMSSTMEIPYSDNMVTFEFATMEYGGSGTHLYQYKLEGFDRDWIISGTNRKAVYTNLDPGTYTFRVRGNNRDNKWNDASTSFQLIVLPPWWRSWWFFTGLAIIVIGGVLLYIINLERTVKLRTLELSKEKERSEKLLYNILPEDVADELKNTGVVIPRNFNNITILFTDFIGFTEIAEKLSANELVDELNFCFGKFDEIITSYNLEKIKTIGDSYMCAGGLSGQKTSSAVNMVRAGLEMQSFIVNRRSERMAMGKIGLQMRLGIHTGPVIAGIVGFKKFQYDIWGDSVNTASRIESAGQAGRVNISETTYYLVNDQFKCENRGKIGIKGKGEIEMYFVNKRI
jgi:class 3 adenylate cyclase/ligand-binding sensor domain-containing protein